MTDDSRGKRVVIIPRQIRQKPIRIQIGGCTMLTVHPPPGRKRMQLEARLQTGSVAVIGASKEPTVGRRMVPSLDRIGFAGAIYPLNPAYPTILGHPCYPSVADLPDAPDVAVFCLGHQRILDAVVGAARRGIKGAVIYDGGFAEQGEEGRRLQERIQAICREADIALCGPNCMGVLNPHHPSTTYLGELRDPTGLAGKVRLG